jgi:hypothetical protein
MVACGRRRIKLWLQLGFSRGQIETRARRFAGHLNFDVPARSSASGDSAAAINRSAAANCASVLSFKDFRPYELIPLLAWFARGGQGRGSCLIGFCWPPRPPLAGVALDDQSPAVPRFLAPQSRATEPDILADMVVTADSDLQLVDTAQKKVFQATTAGDG